MITGQSIGASPRRFVAPAPSPCAVCSSTGVTTPRCPPFTAAQMVASGSSAGMLRWFELLACSVTNGAKTGTHSAASALAVMVFITSETGTSAD